MNPAASLLIVTLTLAGAQQAPPSSASPAGSTGNAETRQPAPGPFIDPNALPVSVDRIQRAITRPPGIRLDLDKPVFRVEILGRNPTIEDILGPDFYKGPAKYGGMTHQEFLDMVTPKDVQGFAAFTNGEGAAVATTSFLMKWGLQQAIHKYKEAKSEREREAARKEVLDALAELEQARARAGLPPK